MQDELVRRVARLEARLDGLAMPEVGGWRLIPDPVVLAAPAASVTFSSLPQNYRALVLVSQTRSSAAAENDMLRCRMNGDTDPNYDWVYGYFRGDNVQSSSAGIGVAFMNIGWAEAANSRASNFAPCLTWFHGYALADREKWALTPGVGFMGDVSATSDMFVANCAGRWRNTDAVTSLTIFCNVGNLVAGSRFALYGVL